MRTLHPSFAHIRFLPLFVGVVNGFETARKRCGTGDDQEPDQTGVRACTTGDLAAAQNLRPPIAHLIDPVWREGHQKVIKLRPIV